MIKQRTMGRTGLKLSELCLGTLNFGWKTDGTTALAILDAYHAAGGNFIQATGQGSRLLLPSTSASMSEEIVGRWWTGRQLRREDLFLASRISVRPPADGGEGALIALVDETCRDSLRRLQTDYLDMLIVEWNDGLAPTSALLPVFDHIVRSGRARFVGAGNFPVWRIVDTLGRAHLRNHCRMEALQADYSLLTRARFEPEAMALCQEQRLAFFARAPLAGGFLAHRPDLSTMYDSVRRDWLLERFGNAYGATAQVAVTDVGSRHGVSAARIALAWVLHNPAVTSAVIGVNSVAQLQELVAATTLSLTPADLDQLHGATAAEEIRLAELASAS